MSDLIIKEYNPKYLFSESGEFEVLPTATKDLMFYKPINKRKQTTYTTNTIPVYPEYNKHDINITPQEIEKIKIIETGQLITELKFKRNDSIIAEDKNLVEKVELYKGFYNYFARTKKKELVLGIITVITCFAALIMLIKLIGG